MRNAFKFKIGEIHISKLGRFNIGETVKIIDVGRIYSSEEGIAKKLKATKWKIRPPFNRKLEGEMADVINMEKSRIDPRYLIELLSNGEQYIIGWHGIVRSEKFLTDDLFEI